VAISAAQTAGANLNAVLSGTDGTQTKTATLMYSIQDFTISPPASAAVVEGTTSNLQFSVAPVAGYSAALNATCDVSQIAGATCTASPLVLNGVGAQAVSVTVAVPIGLVAKDYPVTLTETDASGLAHSATFILAVQDFSLAVGSITAHAGSAGSATLPIASLNNFTGLVGFACSSGLPSGTACVFTAN